MEAHHFEEEWRGLYVTEKIQRFPAPTLSWESQQWSTCYKLQAYWVAVLLVLSPDPTLTRAERIWWLSSIFLVVLTQQSWFHVSQPEHQFEHCHMTDDALLGNSYARGYRAAMHMRAHSLVPRPPSSVSEKGLVNFGTFLGFVGRVVYFYSNLHSDWSGQKCRQFNKSHSKCKPALWLVPLNSCGK